MNSVEYSIRFREITEYLKIVCYTYKFPLFSFVHDTYIHELRDKLYYGILVKLQEEFTNTIRNKDYEFSLTRLEEIKQELDCLMIEKN
jgi:hypothetical protein